MSIYENLKKIKITLLFENLIFYLITVCRNNALWIKLDITSIISEETI